MRYSRFALSALALTLLCGCPTGAQRQFQAMKTSNQQASAELTNCTMAVYNAPETAPIRVHIPPNINDLTLQQLSDVSFATPEEAQIVLFNHPKIHACRKEFIASLTQSEPSLVPILVASYNKSDDDKIALTQRKISWGEYAHRARDRTAETRAAIQAADQRVVSGLQQEHQAELAQRQRAAEALAAWAQTQEIINAANRPVITNCNQFGGMVNCVSR